MSTGEQLQGGAAREESEESEASEVREHVTTAREPSADTVTDSGAECC